MVHKSWHVQNIQNITGDNCTWKYWQKRRHVVAILAFFGYFTSSVLEVHMSMAIVAMVSETSEKKAEFVWDSTLQGYILSASFYGYMSTIFLGGWLSSQVGGKIIFGVGIGGVALLTVITPPLVKLNVYSLIALRAIGGIFQGIAGPCIHQIWAKWAPPLERSKLGSVSFSGYPLGIAFGMSACGVIAERLGWPYIFYITGAMGLIFSVFWFYIVKDDPADDPNISAAELKYIKLSLGVSNQTQKRTSHPWKAIFTSSAVWAIIIVHFTRNWGALMIFTELPKFMSSVLNLKLQKTGFFSALPYFLFFVTLPATGYLSGYLQTKKVLTTTQVRKIVSCFGLIGQVIFMMLAVIFKDIAIVIMCITLAIGFSGIATSGYCVNHLDIAPQHASVLLGISYTAGSFAGIISPMVSEYIIQDETIEQWRLAFIIANVICLVGAIFYGFFASGEKQKWAEIVENKHPHANDCAAAEVN